MDSLNKQILELKNKIAALESKVKDLTLNSQSKSIPPYTKTRTSKGEGWWFIEGKWVSYSIYAD